MPTMATIQLPTDRWLAVRGGFEPQASDPERTNPGKTALTAVLTS
jgi:hypothetical protein